MDSQESLIETIRALKNELSLLRDSAACSQIAWHGCAMCGEGAVRAACNPMGTAGEERFKSIVNQAQDAIFIKDKQRRHIFVNPAMAMNIGISEERLLGNTADDVLEPESAKVVKAVDDKTFQGEIVDEIRRLDIGGRTFYFHTVQAPLRYHEGQVEEIFAIVRDITALRESENALAVSEAKYKTIVEAIDDAIITGSLDGTIISWNKGAEKIFGYSEKEALGRHITLIVPENLKEEQMEIEQKTIASGYQGKYEVMRLHKEGHLIPVEVSTNAVIDHDGRVTALTGILRDISYRKRAEEERKKIEAQLFQAQKMEAVGTLAGGVAHDFNNILGIILGNVELALSDTNKGSLAHERLSESRTACLRAKEVIRQILNISRKQETEFEPVVMNDIVAESLKLIRASLPTSILLKSNTGALSDVVMANPTQIHQVVLNLCANALYAMEGMEGTLSVTLDRVSFPYPYQNTPPDDSSRAFVRLSVQDSGKGMSPELQSRIFEPYFTTKEAGKGSGLGLSVVYGIVRNHHGTITVESAPGFGSTFHLYFPIYEKKVAPVPQTESDVPGGDERILFVDDEEMIVELAEIMLSSLGYRVTGVTSASEAFDRFRANPEAFDLVITDMTMPQMTGSRLAKEIMAIQPGIPVIICSGYSAILNETGAIGMGIRKYLNKPFTQSRLARAIREVLDSKLH